MAAGKILTGVGCTFKSGTTGTAAEVDHTASWSIEAKANVNSHASNSTSGWKQKTAGSKDWTAKVKVFLHDGGAAPLTLGKFYDCEFLLNATGTSKYTGNVLVASLGNVEVDIDDGKEISHEYSLEGNGALIAVGNAPPVT